VTDSNLIWWMRAAAVAAVLAAAGCWFEHDQVNGLSITVFGLFVLPWLLAGCLPAGKFQHAFGMLAGSSMVLLPIAVMLGMLAQLEHSSPWKYWFLVFAMSLTLLIGLVISIGELRREQAFATAAIVAICSLLYEGAVFKVSPALNQVQPQMQALPVPLMYDIEACLTRYKQVHKAYPDSFSALSKDGPCLDKSLLKGIDVSYTASNPEVPRYDLEVKLHSFWTGKAMHLSASEQGVVQASSNQNSEPPYPLANPAQLILEMSDHLNLSYRSRGSIPTNLSELWNYYPYVFSEVAEAPHANEFSSRGYRLLYVPSMTFKSFEITARPEHYGVTGVRSYYLDPYGKIHVTMEDRPASAADDLAPACEYQPFARCQR
jgi:hypothetical protein